MIFSSTLLLKSKENVHQEDRLCFSAKSTSSFTLREKHCNSSSELLCVSLLKHKDGTRTIEMILVSTVLGSNCTFELYNTFSNLKLVVGYWLTSIFYSILRNCHMVISKHSVNTKHKFKLKSKRSFSTLNWKVIKMGKELFRNGTFRYVPTLLQYCNNMKIFVIFKF